MRLRPRTIVIVAIVLVDQHVHIPMAQIRLQAAVHQ